MRKKTALHLDVRYATMIENAFFYSNPPESRLEARSQRPPMQEYIRKLLYKDLSKTTVEKVLRQMRKLSWDDNEVLCLEAGQIFSDITQCFLYTVSSVLLKRVANCTGCILWSTDTALRHKVPC
jgi:hypothetical protein